MRCWLVARDCKPPPLEAKKALKRCARDGESKGVADVNLMFVDVKEARSIEG